MLIHFSFAARLLPRRVVYNTCSGGVMSVRIKQVEHQIRLPGFSLHREKSISISGVARQRAAGRVSSAESIEQTPKRKEHGTS
jgi:hypothetical protein